MRRLLLVLLLLSLRANAIECDWTGVETDSEGCVPFFFWNKATELKCSVIPNCFKFRIIEVDVNEGFFLSETIEQKEKIIEILDTYAVALLKNSKLKDIKIIFYNKNKLSKGFIAEAERYLLEKGVKKEQFKIELR